MKAGSPLARLAYCIRMREATRLAYTSGLNSPSPKASKKPALIFQKARRRGVCWAAANPRQMLHRSHAACVSAVLTTLNTARSMRARTAGP